MPVSLNSVVYYRVAEACAKAGISRNTFTRWVRDGKFDDVMHRDRNGWRLFAEDDICRLRAMANQVLEHSLVQKRDIGNKVPIGKLQETLDSPSKLQSKT
jgi:predicted site-specific integrase-resolvase